MCLTSDKLTDTDIVYIYRTDRLGRSTSDLLTIVEKIKGAGARLVSITDGIDTGTGMVADMFLTLLSVVAQYERSLIAGAVRVTSNIIDRQFDDGIYLNFVQIFCSLFVLTSGWFAGVAQG